MTADLVVHAPGRVNLIGEHTDYSGGLVLPAAIDRGVTLRATVGGHRIRLTSRQFDGEVDVAADGSSPPADGWGRYVSAVAAELAVLGRAPIGLTGELDSDLPAGSGLSSSAALEVVLGTALLAATDGAPNLPPIELAAAMQRAERRGVGVPCGIMDQAASILGRADHAVRLDCGSLEHRHVPLPASLAILLVDSGVRRQLGDSGYAARRRELETGLRLLGDDEPLDPRSLTPAAFDARSRDRDLAALEDGVPLRRVRHVVSENARVDAVVGALTAPGGPDLDALGSLFRDGHDSLRDDFEVSVDELDALVDHAYAAGAVAARMTGGGFGGAIVALVAADDVEAVADRVLRAYAQSHPSRTPTILATRAADGAAVRAPTQN